MLRWGILGTSFISDIVANAITASPSSTITAVFGRDTTRLAAFASKHAITTTYTTLESLLDDEAVDVVYVGLPSHMHSAAVIQAAKRGKAILSEKALATTMEDGHAMMKAVEEAGVFFVEGLMYLSHPVHDMVVEVIRSGRLGEIRGVSGYYAANIAKKANPYGMGTIYNLGCYPVSLLHRIITTSHGASAFSTRQVRGLGNLSHDTTTHARDAALNVRFGCGALATIQSTDSFGNDFSFVVQGDKAVLRFKTNPWLPGAGDNVLEIQEYKGEAEELVVEGKMMDAFGWQVRRVEECVAKGVKEAPGPSPSWADSMEIMGLLTEWEADIMKNSEEK